MLIVLLVTPVNTSDSGFSGATVNVADTGLLVKPLLTADRLMVYDAPGVRLGITTVVMVTLVNKNVSLGSSSDAPLSVKLLHTLLLLADHVTSRLDDVALIRVKLVGGSGTVACCMVIGGQESN